MFDLLITSDKTLHMCKTKSSWCLLHFSLKFEDTTAKKQQIDQMSVVKRGTLFHFNGYSKQEADLQVGVC